MDETVSAQELQRMRASGEPHVLLDVRRQVDYDADDVVIPGALHVDPERIDDWSRTLAPQDRVVVYCVRGGFVSQGVRDALTASGLRVRYLEGGIAAWKARGGTGAAKDPT
jgi:rhodanese-related sulfurtransferase